MRSLLPLLVACGCGSPPRTPSAADPPGPAERDADVIATTTRAPRSDPERALARAGFVFDPALDCVARRSGDPPDPRRYRHELAVRCGSPLYPVDARPLGASLEATALDMKERFAPGVPLALGIGNGVVVVAARLVDIAPFHPGDALLRGEVTMSPVRGAVLVSREGGVTRTSVTIDGRAFVVPVPAEAADVELAIVSDGQTGPLARLRIGQGSPLFGREGSIMERANLARRRLRLAPLLLVPGIGLCDQIPPTIAGQDVSDEASCHWAYRVAAVDVLVSDLAWSPLIQTRFVHPASSFLEVGVVDGDVRLRVSRRFETLAPDAGRRRIIARYRAWWPDLAERGTPPRAFDEVFDTWKGAPDLSAEPPREAKTMLDRVAAKWTTTTRFWTALGTSRSLEKAIEITRPAEKPLAIDAAMIQVRDQSGAMRHLVAVVLVLP